MTLTERERQAVDAAVPAWAAGWLHASKVPSDDPNKKTTFNGPTADDILEAHGIGVDYRRGDVTYAILAGVVMDEGACFARKRKAHRPITDEVVRKAKAMYLRGDGVHKIGAMLGVGRSSIYRALKSAGVEMRGRNGT